MTALHWLMLANSVLWLGLGGYAAFLGRKQAQLEQRLDILETSHD